MKAEKLTKSETWDLKAISHAYGMSKEKLGYEIEIVK